MVTTYQNCGRVRSNIRRINVIASPHKLWPYCQSPTVTCYPLLSIPPCYLCYISDEGALREEGDGGVQEKSSVTYNHRDRWHKVHIQYVVSKVIEWCVS